MAFFEDTLTKAKEVFDVAAKKTGEVVSVQKLKINISSVNSKLNSDFEQLGRLYFDNLKNSTDISESAQELKAQIEDKLAQISELERQIDEQKKNVTCKNCGAKNPDDSAFCSKCGASLKQNEEKSNVKDEASENGENE